jgi:hypothetical protein
MPTGSGHACCNSNLLANICTSEAPGAFEHGLEAVHFATPELTRRVLSGVISHQDRRSAVSFDHRIMSDEPKRVEQSLGNKNAIKRITMKRGPVVGCPDCIIDTIIDGLGRGTSAETWLTTAPIRIIFSLLW